MDEDTLESALQTLQNRLYHRLAFGMMSLCKDYLKDRSAGRAGLNGYSAVMYAHDFTNQGQPKAYSAKLALRTVRVKQHMHLQLTLTLSPKTSLKIQENISKTQY